MGASNPSNVDHLLELENRMDRNTDVNFRCPQPQQQCPPPFWTFATTVTDHQSTVVVVEAVEEDS
ncbi:GM16276 [Drosophila sechellia]|uniref:GM16276 n=1 Tax=Drosophila sechellia TaxID=7238 RepID=B4IN98_DROSE|nr:GM16276 [Drosophila sechellia]